MKIAGWSTKSTVWSRKIFLFFILFSSINATTQNAGLKNFAAHGYNCYLNAAIQCLSNLDSLNNFLVQNQEVLKGSLLEEFSTVINELGKATAAYTGHEGLVLKMPSDQFINPADVITHLFNDAPDKIKDAVEKLVFVQEKRTYTINNSIKTFNFKYENNNSIFFEPTTPVISQLWSISDDNLANDKFVRDDNGYKFPKDTQPPFIDYVKEVCSKKIILDLDKIEKSLTTGHPIDIENATRFSMLSQNERTFLLNLPKTTEISLERKLIPPEILIFGPDGISLAAIKQNILIEKQYLDEGFSTDINYELKAFTGQGLIQYNSYHTWAYVKNNTDEWVEYDDAYVKKIEHFPNDADMKSLAYQIKEFGSVNTTFYELDATSKKILEEYYKKHALQEKLLALKSGLSSLKNKLDLLRTKLERLNIKLNGEK